LFILSAVSMTAVTAGACGPVAPIIQTPEFLANDKYNRKSMADYEEEENLRLWRSLTDEQIPLSDIRTAVYEHSRDIFNGFTGTDHRFTDNRFYIYLNNTGDYEALQFLDTAKQLEERWSRHHSPWYYPRHRGDDSPEQGEFDDIIEYCRNARSKRLGDRYALQVTRALFASRRFDACIEYADSAFRNVADNNLMKRMARRYMAGCWCRLGDTATADSIFAMAGDIWSITGSDPVEYMATNNPGAPQLMEYIRSRAADTTLMLRLIPVARRLLTDRRVTNRGDWNFMLAYVTNTYCHDAAGARTLIYKALQQRFSSSELHDKARIYKMKLDAMTGHREELLADLKWIDGKKEIDYELIRGMLNVIYAHWIPRLWHNKDYSRAILLAGFADCYDNDSDYYDYWSVSDYGCLTFQLMNSLSSAQLVAVCNQMKSHGQMNDFLRRKARTDRDYYNELIGTLALREGNYERARTYLSLVSERYIRRMNIIWYLRRDPFGDKNITSGNPKLDFANRMAEYRQTMTTGRSGDERGLARLMYAIGRQNSFGYCWALTQYWDGWVGNFEPILDYYDYNFAEENYEFLYDYDRSTDFEPVYDRYEKEVAASLAMLQTDEARAEAHYILGNLKTIVKLFPDTERARFVRTSCDRWQSWL
ncbi:MAG: hypothetical protein K2K86_02660, partial [Muribaculaceae bacterium]|nr:hypothetical protein [Muribaculaceae bacterium]